MNQRPQPKDFFQDWKQREALAEGMVPLVGRLHRERNVSLYLYGRNMVNMSVIDIMKAHRFVRQIERNELSEFETFPMIEALAAMDLAPAHIDIGKLTVIHQRDRYSQAPLEFLREQVGEAVGDIRKPLPEPQDVVLFGFGRIGRLVARLLIEKAGGGDVMRLRAVAVRKGKTGRDLAKRAALLRRDSVHGRFQGTIRVLEDEHALVCNGNRIQFIDASDPTQVDYSQYGIKNAIVVDNTGVWRDEEGLTTSSRG